MTPAPKTIEEAFEQFHQDHPDVYDEFVKLAFRMRSRGRSHYSADAIGHVIRFFRITSGKDAAGFKLNNNYTALYARKAMDEHPYLKGFFQTRQRRAA